MASSHSKLRRARASSFRFDQVEKANLKFEWGDAGELTFIANGIYDLGSIYQSIEILSKEKGIEPQIVLDAVKDAMLVAARKHFRTNEELRRGAEREDRARSDLSR